MHTTMLMAVAKFTRILINTCGPAQRLAGLAELGWQRIGVRNALRTEEKTSKCSRESKESLKLKKKESLFWGLTCDCWCLSV